MPFFVIVMVLIPNVTSERDAPLFWAYRASADKTMRAGDHCYAEHVVTFLLILSISLKNGPNLSVGPNQAS
jgi:hypothetical protein